MSDGNFPNAVGTKPRWFDPQKQVSMRYHRIQSLMRQTLLGPLPYGANLPGGCRRRRTPDCSQKRSQFAVKKRQSGSIAANTC